MQSALAGAALFAAALLAIAGSPAAAQAPATPLASIYGVEIEQSDDRDRVLIFADRPIRYRLTQLDAEKVLLHLEGSQLGPDAPPVIDPTSPRRILRVRSFEAGAGPEKEVRVEITRVANIEPVVSARGALIAVDFLKPRRDPEETTIELRLSNTDLHELVRIVSEATGESFLLDDKLSGRVTLHTPTRVTLSEARELLNAALLLAGFTIVPGPEGHQRIVKLARATEASPWTLATLDAIREGYLTTMIHLKAADASEVVKVAKDILGPTLVMIAYPHTNGVILAGIENRIHRALEIISALDEAAQVELIVYRVRHRSVEFVIGIFEERFVKNSEGQGRYEIWPDPRTNAVIVRAPPEQLDEVRDFIRLLDQPEVGRGQLLVYRTRYADPEKLMEILDSLATPTRSSAAIRLSEDATEVSEDLAGRQYNIVVDRPTRALLIQADPDTQEILERLLDQLDLEPPRVALDLKIFEIASNESLDLAFQSITPLTKANSSDDLVAQLFINPSGGGILQEGVLARYAKAPISIDVGGIEVPITQETFAIVAQGVTVTKRMIINPHLVVASGEEQSIVVGDNIPVPVSAPTTDSSNTLVVRQNIERHDTGTKVYVTPTLGQTGTIRVELSLEISSVVSSVAGDPSKVGPTIRQQRLDATMNLRDREVAVMAFAHLPSSAKIVSGIPWIMNIPFIGWFGKSTSDLVLESKMFVAVEARRHLSAIDDTAETIRRRIGFLRATARRNEIPGDLTTGYAVRVTTRRSRRSAESVAEFLGGREAGLRVAEWESGGAAYFDVYIVDLETLEEASERALQATDAGWPAELVVLPGSPGTGFEGFDDDPDAEGADAGR